MDIENTIKIMLKGAADHTDVEEIREKLKILIPMENTLKQARTIENLHTLIKNNGQDFNLSKEELELVNLLA